MRLADWLDRKIVAAKLCGRGMREECGDNAAICFVDAARALQALGTEDVPVVACWSPGRIEVLGKHTDYCGGQSVLATVERGFCMVAVPRDDGVVRILDARRQNACEFPLDENVQPQLGHWSNYPHTVVRRFAKNFPQARRGATIAFVSNLPQSSGMSSSSAFVVGTFLVLAQINNLEQDETYASVIRTPEDLAGYLSTVENGMSFGPLAGDNGVGTFGGSEDHTAILCGQPNRLVQYAFCPVRFQRSIELADDYVFAIASSGVVAEKTGAALEKYNRVSAMVRTIVSTWQTATQRDAPSLAEILAVTRDSGVKLRKLLLDHRNAVFSVTDLVERLCHFTTEVCLIESTPDTIDTATVPVFGELAYESHLMADLHLKNQTAETNRLVGFAEELGAPAASAFGAGFGGSVWALIDKSAAASFLAEWQARYEREFPEPATRSEFFLTRPGVAAFTVTA